MTDLPNFVDAHYLAKLYNCSVDHVRNQARAGIWPCFKIGKQSWRFDLDRIRELVEQPLQPQARAE